MSTPGFDPLARLRSFRFAFAGIVFMLRTQHNAWIHLGITVLVCTAGVVFRISAADWRWLIVAIALVWIAETVNTAFEHLCDVVAPQFHASVQKAKDIAAGAVLICAVAVAILGVMIFVPYLGFS